MAARQRRKRKFDVAISVAGEDRKYAADLAGRLKAKGYSVFYDEDHRARLWGKSQIEIERIYGPSSRYVIPFISKHYVRKDWTRHEFGTAKREEKKRRGEFILPVRIDESRLVGLPDDVFFMDVQRDSMENVASWFEEKCGPVQGRRRPKASGDTRERSKRRCTEVLPLDERAALGLMATSSIPLKVEHYEAVFPAIEWRKICRTLRRRDLIARKDGFLHVSSSASRTILADGRERDERVQQWLSALEPVRGHIDTAPMLAMHYVSLGRLDDTVNVLADVVESTELGHWAEIYRCVIQALARQRLVRRLSGESRVRLCNSLGIILTRAGRHSEAIEVFAKLRRLSHRLKHDWGIGQSYINTGVAYDKSERQDRAAECYRKAIGHARRKDDRVLLGRALGNLAQTILHEKPDAAVELLKESLSVKRSAGDVSGIVSAYGALGNAAAVNGSFKRAIHWYSKSDTAAEAANLPYERSLALYNLGRAHYDLAQRGKAKRYYQRAFAIAQEEGYGDVQLLTLNAIAAAHFEDRSFEPAAGAMEKMLVLAASAGGGQDLICALHGLGVIRLSQHRVSEGLRYLNRALRHARSTKNSDWIVRCLVDRSRPVVGGKLGRPTSRKLRRSAISEQKRGMHDIAADLWRELADELIQSCAATEDVEVAFSSALQCLDQVDTPQADAIDVYAQLHFWRWENGDYESGIEALKSIETLAAKGGLHHKRIQAIDQRGVCLQELQRYGEAEVLHRLALKHARRISDGTQIHTSLNNLGELLRKLGKHRKAVTALTESEDVASSLGDRNGVLMASHNRALALEDIGDESGSSRLLEQCRTRALRWKIWREYVRAWEGLANLAWCQEKLGLAERRYARAFAEAKKRKCHDLRPRIALNYARLLQATGNSKKALRMLGAFEDEVRYCVDSFLYYRTLAELYADTGRFEEARVRWLAAQSASEKTGAAKEAALCIAGLAETLQELGRAGEADQQIKRAVAGETCPEIRVTLMVDRLRFLLKTERPDEAERVFEEAREIARVNKLADACVEMHMVIGEHYWAGEYDSKLNALKAYLVAMVEGVNLGADTLAEISMQVVQELTDEEAAPSQSDFDSLVEKAETWLVEEANEAIARFSLWPLRLAKELLPHLGKPRRFQRTMATFVANNALVAQPQASQPITSAR